MAASASPVRRTILGVPVDLSDRSAVLNWIDQSLESGGCKHVVTLNPETVIAARRDVALRGAIERADLITIDGIGVLLAARLLFRNPSPTERMTGVNLVEVLAKPDAPVFLLGGRLRSGPGTAEVLQTRNGSTSVAGWWEEAQSGTIDDIESIARIRSSGARSVAVAYGVPGQTVWIDRRRAALSEAGVRVAIGVGGALDFISGQAPRAPKLLQRMGLEWLYRLLKEPWRWRRQLALPQFAVLIAFEWLRGLRRSG